MVEQRNAVNEPEVALSGGYVNTVVRVGSTVRRPTGHWTPAVHALLRHLEAADFPYSPRVLGIDEQGREVLTYIEGIPGTRPWPEHLRSDDGVTQLARMLAELSAALQDFAPPADARWRFGGVPAGTHSTNRHGDVGLWNTLWQDDRLVGLLDWDFAEPAPPLWDLAQLAWYGIPLRGRDKGWQACGFSAAPDIAHRLRVLCDAYGAEPEQVLAALVEAQACERDRIITLGGAGLHPYSFFLERGDLAELDGESAWLREHWDTLLG